MWAQAQVIYVICTFSWTKYVCFPLFDYVQDICKRQVASVSKKDFNNYAVCEYFIYVNLLFV